MSELPNVKLRDPVAWLEANVHLDYGNFKRSHHPLIIEPVRMAASKRGGYVGLIGSVKPVSYTHLTLPTILLV